MQVQPPSVTRQAQDREIIPNDDVAGEPFPGSTFHSSFLVEDDPLAIGLEDRTDGCW